MRRLVIATVALFLVCLGVSAQGPGRVEINVYQGPPPAKFSRPALANIPTAPPVLYGPPIYLGPAAVAGSGCYGSRPQASGCTGYQAGCQGYQAGGCISRSGGCYGYQAGYQEPQPIGYVVERVPTGPIRRFFRGY